jgi:DNA polymerase elongation subunit (family B)
MIKILLLDIETKPMEGLMWDIYKEVGSMKFILKDWGILCWAAKWLDDKQIFSEAVINYTSEKPMLLAIRELLDEADVVVTQNGIRFDIPKLKTKFLEYGILPPSPFKNVDTLQVAKKVFNFSSNSLDNIARFLHLGHKMDTGGIDLWIKCMKGDKKAWSKMIRYNKNDVVLLEKVYKRMLPYISSHPNRNYYDGTTGLCPKCGSKKMAKKGWKYLSGGKRQQYQCSKCGGWCVDGKVIKNA